MPNLTLIRGESTYSAQRSTILPRLCALWESSSLSAQVMSVVANRVAHPTSRPKLFVRAAFCRSHVSRMRSRIAERGEVPLPYVMQLDLDRESIEGLLLGEIAVAERHTHLYADLAERARRVADLTTAWACELNRVEELDRIRDIRLLLPILRADGFKEWVKAPLPPPDSS